MRRVAASWNFIRVGGWGFARRHAAPTSTNAVVAGGETASAEQRHMLPTRVRKIRGVRACDWIACALLIGAAVLVAVTLLSSHHDPAPPGPPGQNRVAPALRAEQVRASRARPGRQGAQATSGRPARPVPLGLSPPPSPYTPIYGDRAMALIFSRKFLTHTNMCISVTRAIVPSAVAPTAAAGAGPIPTASRAAPR